MIMMMIIIALPRFQKNIILSLKDCAFLGGRKFDRTSLNGGGFFEAGPHIEKNIEKKFFSNNIIFV